LNEILSALASQWPSPAAFSRFHAGFSDTRLRLMRDDIFAELVSFQDALQEDCRYYASRRIRDYQPADSHDD